MKALVIGAGVIGLSTAIRLREAGWDVAVWAEKFSPNTTSDIAAALWYPYKSSPEHLVKHWGKKTFEEFCRLAQNKETGVRLVRGKKYFHRPMGDPWWKPLTPFFSRCRPEDVPTGILAGYEMDLPLIDMSRYMPYLFKRVCDGGCTTRQTRLNALSEIQGDFDLVVSCSGLGAKELVRDKEIFPIRGQTIRVGPLGKETFLLDSDNPKGMVYVISRGNETILGGIADDHDDRIQEVPTITEDIYERCCASMPELRSLPRLGVCVGLRPGRSAIRLEEERTTLAYRLFHNYGHGGSGVTLSWGCADAIVEAIQTE